MTETQSECLNGYLTLLRDFAAGKLDARLFESTYIHKFKTERVELPENIFNVLDRLFAEADAYCPDSDVKSTDCIGDAQLLAGAKEALAQIDALK